MSITFQHGKNEVLDYTLDWGPWLAQEDDSITGTPTWTAETGLTLSNPSNTTDTATNWVQIGASVSRGKVLTLTCRVTTASGRTAERSIDIQVVTTVQL